MSIKFHPVDHGDSKEQRTLVLSENYRRVIFGKGIRARIDVQDEHEEIDLQHSSDVLAAVKLETGHGSPRQFLTVGADHVMVVWTFQGRHRLSLTGHTDRIEGVWELTDVDRVVSWSRDRTARVWNSRTGDEICRITTTIDSTRELLVASTEEFLCFMESVGARMVATDGTELALLRKQTALLKEIHHLDSGRWLTEGGGSFRLWSREGKLLQQLDRGFSFADGYLDLPDGRLLIADLADQLLLFDTDGTRLARRAADSQLSQRIRAFLRARKDAFTEMEARPTYQHHEHLCSPIERPTIAADELSELELSEATLKKNRPLWDFFNRPIFKSIKTAMRKEIEVADSARNEARRALDDHRSRATRALRFRKISGVLFIGAVLGALLSYAGDSLPLTVVTAIVAAGAGYSAIQQHRTGRAMREAATALQPIPPQADKLIDDIKAYRRRILSGIPVVNAPHLYYGREVQSAIAETIKNKLEPMALAECGLAREEVVFTGRQAIVLRDWALIQTNSPGADKISPHDLVSFWWAHDGEILFAVQFLQFIFLTNDKIDVFTTYYDFIAEKVVGKEAHAFYYKDVTNISKRDVDRPTGIAGAQRDVQATEIAMAVSSGQRITLTVLNDQSVSLLRGNGGGKDEATPKRDLLAQLETQREDIRADRALTEEVRREELEAIEGQIATLKAEMVDPDKSAGVARQADEAIANIRSRIREHKQVESRPNVVV